MTRKRPLFGTLAALAALPAASLSCPVAAQDAPEIVVAASLHRLEIERILEADNLDTGLSPRTIAEAMARIPQGRAPDDFWARYQAHVRAWLWLAGVSETVPANTHTVLAAEDAVNATFDEVERLALRYGARLPQRR